MLILKELNNIGRKERNKIKLIKTKLMQQLLITFLENFFFKYKMK